MPSSTSATALQPSLFEASATAAGSLDTSLDTSSIRRTELSDGAWVDTCPGWLTEADDLCLRLINTVPWRAERRPMYDKVVAVPRLSCFYDVDAPLPDPEIATMRDLLSAYYEPTLGQPLVTTGMCLYRDGRDSVAWHGDSLRPRIDIGGDVSWTQAARHRVRGSSELANTVVAIVSLGSPRSLLLRPRGGGASSRFSAGHGDLVVMGGTCQQTWEHSVPKTARPVGPRISIQFRPRNVV